MKRPRTVDGPKLRRNAKKGRIAENVCNGGLVYVKLLGAWALLVLADYLLGFRFEYLWPFWLLLRSIIDSFRYQGLAFSVFFVCVTVTSDLVCFLFIPVQWLLFLASTYVWVQYVWHTDRGICMPTVSLWLVFIYFEASVRLKDISVVQKAAAFPFTLDLCRPFAAHCIGYPVVTLGFGIKSYLGGWRLQRRQREVGKENELYSQLLTEALPATWYGPGTRSSSEFDQPSLIAPDEFGQSPVERSDLVISSSNGASPLCRSPPWVSLRVRKSWWNGVRERVWSMWMDRSWSESPSTHGSDEDEESSVDGRSKPTMNGATKIRPNSGQRQSQSRVRQRGRHTTPQFTKEIIVNSGPSQANTNPASINADNTTEQNSDNNNKVDKDFAESLESDLEKLRNELRSSRTQETDLRSQLNQVLSSEKAAKYDLQQSRIRTEQLDNKLQKLMISREQDKTAMQTLEKKLIEAQRLKNEAEKDLNQERKSKQKEEAAAARALAQANNRSECGDSCKQRRRELESDIKQLRREMRHKDDQLSQLESELLALRQYKEAHNAEILMSALSTMREKNSHLEQSLSAENRLKQDLFRALGDAKCQVESIQNQLRIKDCENEELRRKLAKDIDQHRTAGMTPPPPTPIVNGQPDNMELLTNALANVAATAYINPYGSAFSGSSSTTSEHFLDGNSTNPTTTDYLPIGTSGGLNRLSFTPPRSN